MGLKELFIKEEEQPRDKWVFDTPQFNNYTNELTKVLEEVCV